MPTPRNVLEVSSKHSSFQTPRTVLQTSGVARGTTLHVATPMSAVPPANFKTSVLAVPSNQFVVGIFACLKTRLEFARPRCVLVLPMSNRRIIKKRGFGERGVSWRLPSASQLHWNHQPRTGAVSETNRSIVVVLVLDPVHREVCFAFAH